MNLTAIQVPTAIATKCNWNDYLSYIFTKKKPFNQLAYTKKVEQFEKAISLNQLNAVEKLSPIDQVALIEALTKTNQVNPLNLAENLQKHPVFRNKILKISKKLKTKNGYRLSNLNDVFDEIFRLNNPQFDAVFTKKWKGKEKELIDQWINQELGRRNMESVAKQLGLLKNETALEKFRLWKQRQRNGIEIALNASTNGPMIYFFKTPGKMPNIKFFKANESLLNKIEQNGLESIKPELHAHYRNPAIAQLVYDNIKKNYGRVFKALIAYYTYQNWSEIKKQTQLAYNIASTGIQNLFIDNQKLQNQIDKTFSLEEAQEEEIMNTLQTISDESNGKLKPEDIWNQVKAHLELTTEDLKPNLINPDAKLSDHKNKVNEKEIEAISLKLIAEMIEQKTIHPSVIQQYKNWLKKRDKNSST
jgi:hypothetical protein